MRDVRELACWSRLPQTVCLAAAMGLHLSWTDLIFSGLMLPTGLQALAYSVSAICFAAGLFALSLAGPARTRPLSSPALRLFAGLGLSVGSLGVVAVYAGNTPAPLAMALGCGVMTGLLSALLFGSLGVAFEGSDDTTTIVASIAGYLVCVTLPTLLAMATSALSPAIAVIMPVAVALLLNGTKRSEEDAGPSEGNLDARTLETSKAERSATARFVACVALIGFVNELTRTVNGSIVMEAVSRYFVIAGLIQMLLPAVCIVGMYFMFERIKGTVPFVRCYRGFMFLSIAALLFPLTQTDPLSPSSAAFMGIHVAIYACLGCFSWLVALKIGCGMPSLGTSLLFQLFSVKAVCSIAGIWCGRGISAFSESLSPVLLALNVSIMLLLAAYLLVFPESCLATLVKLAQPKGDGPFMEACRAIIKEYGLSKREGEIMVMFGKGRNRAYVCEQLVLSKSTVSMHRQHIYRKLDIHSQQELINLIDQTKKALNGM